MNFFIRRRLLKTGREMVRQARRLRDYRGDILTDTELRKLAEAEQGLRIALESEDMDLIRKERDLLAGHIVRMTPIRSLPGLRDNFEILVVAVAVAMGFRAYFVQPFKIPTGSMQPTLYGIHSESGAKPTIMDRLPLKYLKWLVAGEWYRQVVAEESGPVMMIEDNQQGAPERYLVVGSHRYKIPRDVPRIVLPPNGIVNAGHLLWSGTVVAGDHVFVNKVIWNFRRPRRGEIMVFKTDGIKTLPQDTHYIKRLIGCPGETISIDQPNVVINGAVVKEPHPILAIERKLPPHDQFPYNLGYKAPIGPDAMYLTNPTDTFRLGPGQYFALGDNTDNSKDGRYWGAVPERNLVGPAFMLYWPFSKRWGTIR